MSHEPGCSIAWFYSSGSLCSGRRPASHGGPRQRCRAVAPEYGGGREYDLEAEFMDELGPLPKDHAVQQVSGTAAYMQLIASFLSILSGLKLGADTSSL